MRPRKKSGNDEIRTRDMFLNPSVGRKAPTAEKNESRPIENGNHYRIKINSNSKHSWLGGAEKQSPELTF